MDILGLGLLQINDWLLLFTFLLVLGYYYYSWNFDYWESRGIPGPKPIPVFGNLIPYIKHGILSTDIEYAKKYGQVYGVFSSRRPCLMVQDVEYLKHIFVKNHHDFPNRNVFGADPVSDSMLNNARGQQWKVLRVIMSPTFSTGKLKVMSGQINECAKELVHSMSKEANTGKAFEVKKYAGAFTMDVIASTAFGFNINSQKDPDNEFVRMAKKAFEFKFLGLVFIISFFFPFAKPLLRKLNISVFPKDLRAFFIEVTTQTMDARKESGEKRPDFMQLMINAHKESDEDNNEDKEHDKEFKEISKGVAKRSLTKDEIVAQGVLFFVAGYETTASSITYLLYNLALNPDIQEKLYEEIMGVVADSEEITYNMLSEMNLLDMCVQESLRMYPPAARTDRVAERDTRIKDLEIPKGMIVAVPVYAIHHDPKIWPEPEKFNPYRFTPEEKAKHNSYDWMPFGAGPRNCLAMRLALTEIKIAVAQLVRSYKFVRSGETRVPLELKPSALVTPKNEIMLEIEKR